MKHLPREILFVFTYRYLEILRMRRKADTAYSTVASFHKKQFEVLIDSGEEKAV